MPSSDSHDLYTEIDSLRRRVQELELENRKLVSQLSSCHCAKEASYVHLEEATKSANNGTEKKGYQPSTLRHSEKRHVALKIMYFGKRFHGFASEAQQDPTIESEMFKALKRTKLLIGNKVESNYARCGRTDKGVSSTGQVISLYLRSNLKETGRNTKPEIDYVNVLNRVLPPDIRVIGWCPVSIDFSARFSCFSREYRYLFWRRNFNISAMQNAADKLIGEYDFRNFCKMDAANVKNYTRRITKFSLSPCNQRFNDDELWEMTIKGSAFLWHQVRCMVAVLFLIGQGLESSDVIDILLDTKVTPRKPQYSMAPELPLILRSCDYDNVNFICSADAKRTLQEHLTTEFQTQMLQAAIYQEALSCLCPTEGNSTARNKKKRNYVSILLRPTEPSYDERWAKLNGQNTVG